MAAKEDVSKPFEEDAGEILQLCDESNDDGHGGATYEFDVDVMKSQLGIDDILKSVAALTELVKRKVDNSAHAEVGLKRAKLVTQVASQNLWRTRSRRSRAGTRLQETVNSLESLKLTKNSGLICLNRFV